MLHTHTQSLLYTSTAVDQVTPNYYKIFEDLDSSWYMTGRFAGASLVSNTHGIQYPWLNVGDSNTTNMGGRNVGLFFR
jgi:hypothetical protein